MAEKTNIVKNVNNNEKGTALQAVKAVAVLVVICLVCCLLLALCNDLLYVTEEEKFNRAMRKIYPEFSLAEEVALDSKYSSNATYGEVLSVFKSTDGAYILQTKGIGGFSSGPRAERQQLLPGRKSHDCRLDDCSQRRTVLHRQHHKQSSENMVHRRFHFRSSIGQRRKRIR